MLVWYARERANDGSEREWSRCHFAARPKDKLFIKQKFRPEWGGNQAHAGCVLVLREEEKSD